jgi:hypothetical protein
MKRKKWPLILLALGMSLWGASVSQGALLAYEGFDYPNDGPQLDSRNGGFGWDTPWSEGSITDFDHLTQDDTSLDSGAFPFEPTGDRVAGQGGTIIRRFTDNILMTTEGSVLYASLLLRKDADGGTAGDNVEFSLGSQATTNLVRVGSTSDERWFINFNGSVANTDPFNVDENYFVVLKLVSRADPAVADEAYVAIYGENDIVPTEEPAVWDMAVTRISGANVEVLRLAMGANAAGGFDEFRIGRNWSAVAVPEPASVVLATGLLAGVAVWRRRRK